jgi:hypothetical protein
MEYSKIKELATNYVFESDFWDSKEEYTNAFNISDIEDLKTFNFIFLIESNNADKEKQRQELEPIFKSCIAFKAENINHKNKYIIFHPSTRPNYKYQLSYFDQYGAIMDERSETTKEAIEKYLRVCKEYKIIETIV